MIDFARAAIARRWEKGGGDLGPLGSALSALASRAFALRLCRPLALPKGARVVGVGGSTLGGSGKTPFAIALARALSDRGETVALVGHAYRARPGRARLVTPNDLVREVGDEALEALGAGARVVVGPTRQAAVDRAAREATTIVVDGLLQTRPERLGRSVLVVDARRPWGAGRVPPFGDLSADALSLARAADVCVALADELDHELPAIDLPIPVLTVRTRLGPIPSGKVGLVLAMARPERVLRALSQRGVVPVAVELLADHARPSRRCLARLARRDVALWLTTPKTRPLLPSEIGGAPVVALALTLVLDSRVCSACVP